MKWRYNWEKDWTTELLPRQFYCKYCYETREVYYLHDDFVSTKTEFGIMMVCSHCTYHLAPITLSLSKEELALLDKTPMKFHYHGSTNIGGLRKDLINEMPVIPYGFKNGKPQYPRKILLDHDKADALKDLK